MLFKFGTGQGQKADAAQAFDITRAALHEPERLRKDSRQRLLDALREQSVLPWLTAELAAKYGL